MKVFLSTLYLLPLLVALTTITNCESGEERPGEKDGGSANMKKTKTAEKQQQDPEKEREYPGYDYRTDPNYVKKKPMKEGEDGQVAQAGTGQDATAGTTQAGPVSQKNPKGLPEKFVKEGFINPHTYIVHVSVPTEGDKAEMKNQARKTGRKRAQNMLENFIKKSQKVDKVSFQSRAQLKAIIQGKGHLPFDKKDGKDRLYVFRVVHQGLKLKLLDMK